MIDSGSKLSAISESFYNKNISQFKKCPTLPINTIKAVGFNGAISDKIKKQIFTEIQIGNKKFDLPFIIIPKLVKNCILGIDSLNKLNMILNTQNKTLTLDNHIIINYSENIHDDQTHINTINYIYDMCNVIHDTELDPEYDNSIELSEHEIDKKLENTEGINDKEKSQLKALILKYKHIFKKKQEN